MANNQHRRSHQWQTGGPILMAKPAPKWSLLPGSRQFQILYRLPFKSFSNSAIDTPSTPGAPLFALTFSHASQTARFDISNGLPDDFNLSMRFLPEDFRLTGRIKPR